MDAMNQFQQQQQFQHHLQQHQLQQHQQNMQASAFGMTPGMQSKFIFFGVHKYLTVISCRRSRTEPDIKTCI